MSGLFPQHAHYNYDNGDDTYDHSHDGEEGGWINVERWYSCFGPYLFFLYLCNCLVKSGHRPCTLILYVHNFGSFFFLSTFIPTTSQRLQTISDAPLQNEEHTSIWGFACESFVHKRSIWGFDKIFKAKKEKVIGTFCPTSHCWEGVWICSIYVCMQYLEDKPKPYINRHFLRKHQQICFCPMCKRLFGGERNMKRRLKKAHKSPANTET